MVKICDTDYPNNSKYEENFELFPFPLSNFQKYAIESVVEGQHCLVTAHTGSGKTLPAEFAIKHFVSKGKKVIYTSPIKALSNQKYYDFQQKYPDIKFGLFTGDIKTNPEADVLIMTTEILMNRLFQYQQMEEMPSQMDFQINIKEELACVVFDEVHYINDAHRGQNWEKTILMLPHHVQMVMLSATIDGPEKFAKWCERGGDKEVYLCSTNHRIVPLTHYGFLTTTEAIYKNIRDDTLKKEIRDNMNKLILLQDHKGKYNEEGRLKIKKYQELLKEKKVFMKRPHVLNQLSKYLRDNDMLPCIVFVFSRKQVERCAEEVTIPLLEDDSKVPYIVKKECDQILMKLPNYKEYMNLPEYHQLVSLLEKGIGIHHSGMIPVLREIVELMISKRYIKMLFATESFAIGLDCPIKTAVFSSATKYDGIEERYLLPHEYTQMAGRAGRRGIDKLGYVVHCNNLFPLLPSNQYEKLMCGIPQKLVSKYKISYNLILNLLQSGQTNDFSKFSNNSMIYDRIKRNMNEKNDEIQEIDEEYKRLSGQTELLRTSKAVCEEYMELETKLPYMKNKQRKAGERQKSQLLEANKFLSKDLEIIRKLVNVEKTREQLQKEHINLKGFIDVQTDKVCEIMYQTGFIERNELGGFQMTKKGHISSYIAEVHPLILGEIIAETDYFKEQSVDELIQYLSIFCDVKVKDDYKTYFPPRNNLYQMTNDKYQYYDITEANFECTTGLEYKDVLCYDLYEFMERWINCKTEMECKELIQDIYDKKEISLGDFNKSLLKISNIAREIGNMAKDLKYVDLESKLSKIDERLLKYVATAQSLYV